MKLSNKQAVELLQTLLPSAEVVEDDDADFSSEDAVSEIRSGFKGHFERELESSFHAKHINSFRTAVARTMGINLPAMEGKKWAEIAAIIKDQLKTPATDSNWEEMYNNALTEHEATLKKIQDDHAAALTAEQRKIIDKDINNAFLSYVNTLAIKSGDRAKQAAALRGQLERDGYVVGLDGEKISFTKDGKAVAKADAILKQVSEDILPLAGSTAHVKPTDVLGDNKKVAGITTTDAPAVSTINDIGGFADLIGQ